MSRSQPSPRVRTPMAGGGRSPPRWHPDDPGYRDRVAAELKSPSGGGCGQAAPDERPARTLAPSRALTSTCPTDRPWSGSDWATAAPADLRSAGAAASASPAPCLLTRGLGATSSAPSPEGLLLGGYSFSLKSSKPGDRRSVLASDAAQVAAYERAVRLADGVALAEGPGGEIRPRR